jgi:hypothetical protein
VRDLDSASSPSSPIIYGSAWKHTLPALQVFPADSGKENAEIAQANPAPQTQQKSFHPLIPSGRATPHLPSTLLHLTASSPQILYPFIQNHFDPKMCLKTQFSAKTLNLTLQAKPL